jgi:hypothetical protein
MRRFLALSAVLVAASCTGYTGDTWVEVLSPTDRIAVSDYTVKEVVTRTVAHP